MDAEARLLERPKLPAGRLRVSRGAILLLFASAALMTLWSFVVPVFESPDEQSHWQYVRYLRVNKKLPFYSKEIVEANHPPLYYLVMAPFANYSDIPPSLSWYGPEGYVTPALPRLYQNSYSDYVRYWPIRAARLGTVLISMVAVFFCYASGLEATGREATGLLAGALAAFLPQFTFRAMNVSNDAMVTALSAVVLYCIVRMVRRGITTGLALAAAVAIAAAFLSKTNALLFPIPFAFAVLTAKTGWKDRLKYLSLLLVSIALAAPWVIRNQVLYGDPLAQNAMLSAVDFLIRQKSITSPYFIHVFPYNLAISFVGLFGWASLRSPRWLYHFFWLTAAVGFVGCVIGLVRHRIDRLKNSRPGFTQLDPRLAAVLVLIPVLNLIVVIYVNLTLDQPQGRYMFPSLPALALLVAIGLESLPYWRGGMSRSLAAGLALLNLYVLLRVVLPGYWPPPSMALSDAAKILQPAAMASDPPGDWRPGKPAVGPANELVMARDSHQFIFKLDVPAASYNYFTCTLKGSAERGLVTGTLYVGFCSGDETEQQKLQFKWLCDGADHPVIVPLWTVPGWAGRLSELRLDPDSESRVGSEPRVSSLESRVGSESGILSRESGVKRVPATAGDNQQEFSVRITSPALVGSLTSWRGP